MYCKLLFIVGIIASVSFQFGHTLYCSTCFDLGACKNSTTTFCDATAAEATRTAAKMFYDDVKLFQSNDFECFYGRYGSDKTPYGDLRGCIMRGVIDCYSYNANKNMELCNVCDTDYCNSMGTVESSVLITTVPSSILITLGLVVLSKVF